MSIIIKDKDLEFIDYIHDQSLVKVMCFIKSRLLYVTQKAVFMLEVRMCFV